MATPKTPSAQAQVTSDLALVLSTLEGNPALGRALTDPAAPSAAKVALIERVFPDLSASTMVVLRQGMGRTWESTRALRAWIEDSRVLAAWEWAQQAGTLSKAIDEVFGFSRLVAENHEVRAALTDRRVPLSSRQDLAKTILSDSMHDASIDIACAALGSRRGTIDAMIKAFLHMGADKAGARLAVATVAKAMPEDQKAHMAAALGSRLGTKIIVQEIVDPTVLGGVRVECGAEVFDSTLASRLEAVRRDFA